MVSMNGNSEITLNRIHKYLENFEILKQKLLIILDDFTLYRKTTIVVDSLNLSVTFIWQNGWKIRYRYVTDTLQILYKKQVIRLSNVSFYHLEWSKLWIIIMFMSMNTLCYYLCAFLIKFFPCRLHNIYIKKTWIFFFFQLLGIKTSPNYDTNKLKILKIPEIFSSCT